MVCRKCGSKIEEGWICCPNCGEDVHIESRLRVDEGSGGDEKLSNEGAIVNVERITLNTKSTVPDMGSTVQDVDEKSFLSPSRNILRILALIALVCFFCPLFMVSCAGEELFTLSGEELALGFQYMDEDIEGNLVYGTLALFPFLGLCSVLAGHKKPDGHVNYEKVKEGFYENAVAAGATVIMIRYFKNTLIDAFKETAINITPCTALHIMSGVCIISVFLGGYQAYQMELHGGNETSVKWITALKCYGRILAGSVVLVFIALAISYYLGGLGLDEISEEMMTDYSAMAGIANKLGFN